MKQIDLLSLLVDKHYDDLIFSLNASGIDLNSNHWDTDIIHRNAYKSAAILISVAVRRLKFWDVFLQAVIAGLQREDMINETMNLICETFAHIDALPPLGIIQHTLDPDLLKIYSMDLSNWLEKYLQGSQDTICLRPDCMIEYLQ